MLGRCKHRRNRQCSSCHVSFRLEAALESGDRSTACRHGARRRHHSEENHSGICHIAVSGRDVKSVLKLNDGRSDMSLHDFLTLLVTAALIVLAAAVYSPFAESLSPVLTSAGAY